MTPALNLGMENYPETVPGRVHFLPEAGASTGQRGIFTPWNNMSQNSTTPDVTQSAGNFGSETLNTGHEFTFRAPVMAPVFQERNGVFMFDQAWSAAQTEMFREKLVALGLLRSSVEQSRIPVMFGMGDERQNAFGLEGQASSYNPPPNQLNTESYSQVLATENDNSRAWEAPQVDFHDANSENNNDFTPSFYSQPMPQNTTEIVQNHPFDSAVNGSNSGTGNDSSVRTNSAVHQVHPLGVQSNSGSSRNLTDTQLSMPQYKPAPVQDFIGNADFNSTQSFNFQGHSNAPFTNQSGLSAGQNLHKGSSAGPHTFGLPSSMNRNTWSRGPGPQPQETAFPNISSTLADPVVGTYFAQEAHLPQVPRSFHSMPSSQVADPLPLASSLNKVDYGKQKHAEVVGDSLDAVLPGSKSGSGPSTIPGSSLSMNSKTKGRPVSQTVNLDKDQNGIATATAVLSDDLLALAQMETVCQWGGSCEYPIKCGSKSAILDHLRQCHPPLQSAELDDSGVMGMVRWNTKVRCLWTGCNKVIVFENLGKHIGARHTPGWARACPDCKRVLSRPDALDRHLKVRMLNGVCPGEDKRKLDSDSNGQQSKRQRVFGGHLLT